MEAESFAQPGGWVLDTQFIEIMGSPYLMAHGMGVPVKDASTAVTFPSAGKYRVFVRTKDWVAKWKDPGAPGKFQLAIDGQPLSETFGNKGAEWAWQDGGTVEIAKPRGDPRAARSHRIQRPLRRHSLHERPRLRAAERRRWAREIPRRRARSP